MPTIIRVIRYRARPPSSDINADLYLLLMGLVVRRPSALQASRGTFTAAGDARRWGAMCWFFSALVWAAPKPVDGASRSAPWHTSPRTPGTRSCSLPTLFGLFFPDGQTTRTMQTRASVCSACSSEDHEASHLSEAQHARGFESGRWPARCSRSRRYHALGAGQVGARSSVASREVRNRHVSYDGSYASY